MRPALQNNKRAVCTLYLKLTVMYCEYQIVQCGDVERLIKKCTAEDESSSSTGHGGRDRMLSTYLMIYWVTYHISI